MTDTTIQSWMRYCNSQGINRDGQATRLGMNPSDYYSCFTGAKPFRDEILQRMQQIIEGRNNLDKIVIKTKLLKEFEDYVQRSQREHSIFTLVSPTGQGKTMAAKYLANQYGCKYYVTLCDMQRKKVAMIGKFARDIARAYGFSRIAENNIRQLIDKLQSDYRTTLIIDEAQRLITEDWGYFKVFQDMIDNIPNLSIILLGNFKFYDQMMVAPERTYSGTEDEEQILRRFTLIHKLPRLCAADVKLWCEYNNILLKSGDHKELADFFGNRAALSDMETVRQEIIRLIYKNKITGWKDVTYKTFITVYKAIHKGITVNEEENTETETMQESGYLKAVGA